MMALKVNMVVRVDRLASDDRGMVGVAGADEGLDAVDEGLDGEEQKKLDVLSNDVFVKALISSGRTIFGIYMVKDKENPTLNYVLQSGKNLLDAGYCRYGSFCMLVLSTRNGINGFTLDPSIGKFILTHPDIKVPKKGKIYSTNEGNAQYWDEPTTK
ncbi:Fructose-1,6-bisphosphatase, cytosolic [Camellia lanceoleosa]|uniref:Fructose-1,6-bisphosphatase, cytosolic n=1 Tax=Camellia lanceoleosa TaxID=1840588 RepID=A0ACC0GAI5_9ERIC|nr:Fructose-1,6-bisphosphatase, cytosolic [Camellia lanceoleosa]